MRNLSYENDFNLNENETACRTYFHKKCFALRLVLKQGHKRTRKWPILPAAIAHLQDARRAQSMKANNRYNRYLSILSILIDRLISEIDENRSPRKLLVSIFIDSHRLYRFSWLLSIFLVSF